jgi:glycosyltransferase involved in cell wall biosynthesis
MNVLYTSFDEVPAFKGSTTHILANCRGITRQHNMTLVTLGNTPLPKQKNFRHHPLPLTERNYLKKGLAFRQKVAHIIEQARPDVIQFRTPWEGLAAEKQGQPTIYEVNGLPSVEIRSIYPAATERAIRVLESDEQLCLKRADIVLCHCSKTRRYLVTQRRVPKKKIVLIPNGYDQPQARVKTSHDTPHDALRLVYLGTLSNWQGLLWSLPVFRRLQGRVELDVYGPLHKNNIKELKRRIRKLKLQETVRYNGVLSKQDVHPTLGEYDIGFAPFLKDLRNAVQGCCPVKLLDYKIAGLPVLTSSLMITRPFVEDGKNGIQFRPNSLRSLTEAMTLLVHGRYDLQALSEASLRSLDTFSTWDECGAQLLAVYNNLVAA